MQALCCGKAISVSYSEFVFVALSYPASNAHAPYYFVFYGLFGTVIIFSHYLINAHDFREAGENKMCFDFMQDFCLKHFSFHEELGNVLS